jgi:hypothetical protein
MSTQVIKVLPPSPDPDRPSHHSFFFASPRSRLVLQHLSFDSEGSRRHAAPTHLHPKRDERPERRRVRVARREHHEARRVLARETEEAAHPRVGLRALSRERLARQIEHHRAEPTRAEEDLRGSRCCAQVARRHVHDDERFEVEPRFFEIGGEDGPDGSADVSRPLLGAREDPSDRVSMGLRLDAERDRRTRPRDRRPAAQLHDSSGRELRSSSRELLLLLRRRRREESERGRGHIDRMPERMHRVKTRAGYSV